MKGKETTGRIVVLLILAALGAAAGLYVLGNQPTGLPLQGGDKLELSVELTEADGVRPGVGQPVAVAGVSVGLIQDVRVGPNGAAVLDIGLERDKIDAVYANARAHLEPITPLKDLILNLEPGGPPADQLDEGATIAAANTVPPAELSTLLSELDTDTRSFLRSLIVSLGQGTRDRGEDLRQALASMGPTAGQIRRVTAALDGRRRELARLVTNLGRVTHAASRDERLSAVVVAGNATLEAVASEDASLRTAIGQLPRSLAITQDTLQETAELADEVAPALEALQPSLDRLPQTLDEIRALSETTERELADPIRPLVRRARPLARDLSAALPRLADVAPNGTQAVRSLEYLLNETAYNPPGDDEGGLFWTPWFIHNWYSMAGGIGDAHGAIGRTLPFVSCEPGRTASREIEVLVQTAFGLNELCP